MLQDAELAWTAQTVPDRASATAQRARTLSMAFARFREQRARYESALEELRERCKYWLEDYTLFSAAAEASSGASWTTWSRELAHHEPQACAARGAHCATESRTTSSNS